MKLFIASPRAFLAFALAFFVLCIPIASCKKESSISNFHVVKDNSKLLQIVKDWVSSENLELHQINTTLVRTIEGVGKWKTDVVSVGKKGVVNTEVISHYNGGSLR